MAIQEVFSVVSGGLSHGVAHPRKLDVSVDVDLNSLVGESAGRVHANWYAMAGRGISALAGDVQGLSNLESMPRRVLAELWWERWFLDDALRVKLGKVDTNCEFAFSEVAGDFLNSSMGYSPTIFTLPTFPDPAWSAQVEWRAQELVSARLAVADGAGQEGVKTGAHGPSTLLGSPADLFLVGEVDLAWNSGGGGRIQFGGWRHTGVFARFDGGTEPHATGGFVVLDQTLWREPELQQGTPLPYEGESCALSVGRLVRADQGECVELFVQLGTAAAQLSAIDGHLGAGLLWSEFVEGQALGLGASRAELSDATGAGFGDAHETVIELTWRWDLNDSVTIQPDLQYIMNPGGVRSTRDAIVVGCRATWRL
jgi:carbohydrate-selective porin OprB